MANSAPSMISGLSTCCSLATTETHLPAISINLKSFWQARLHTNNACFWTHYYSCNLESPISCVFNWHLAANNISGWARSCALGPLTGTGSSCFRALLELLQRSPWCWWLPCSPSATCCSYWSGCLLLVQWSMASLSCHPGDNPPRKQIWDCFMICQWYISFYMFLLQPPTLQHLHRPPVFSKDEFERFSNFATAGNTFLSTPRSKPINFTVGKPSQSKALLPCV